LGTGHRSGGQSAGIVVRVTVGQGVVRGGSWVMAVVTIGGGFVGRAGFSVGPPRRDVDTGHGWS